MRRRVRHLVGVMLVLVGASAAAETEPPTHECAEVADPLQRLSCYDKTFPPRRTQARSAPATPAPAPLPAEEFGFTDAQRREQATDDRKTDTSPKEVHATVSTLSKRRNGTFATTLDNGQVWGQIELNSKARIKPGDAVVIRKAAFGSYLLVTPDGIGTRVQRIE